MAHDGDWWAWFGGTDAPEESSVVQLVPIPTEATARGLDLVPVDFAARAVCRLGHRQRYLARTLGHPCWLAVAEDAGSVRLRRASPSGLMTGWRM